MDDVTQFCVEEAVFARLDLVERYALGEATEPEAAVPGFDPMPDMVRASHDRLAAYTGAR